MKPEHLKFPSKIPGPKVSSLRKPLCEPEVNSDELFNRRLEELLDAEATDVFASTAPNQLSV